MTVYTRTRVRKIHYFKVLRPWYRLLDWWQEHDLTNRIMTSRSMRFTLWVTPKLLRLLFWLMKILAAAIFICGLGTFLILGFGAVGKRR